MSIEITGPETTFTNAVRDGIAECMAADELVFVAGEDVGEYGGVWRTFSGLHERFGAKRLVDTPISEQAIVGLGVGAAMGGLRPVVDLMFCDFVAVAMDQIANQAAKMKYMFGGEARLPLTITTWPGAGVGAAAQHSQSLEAWLCHTPGLKVVMPTTPYDAKGLMISAIQDDNPVFFLGNKRLLGLSGPVPTGMYTVPLGQARIARPGTDVTVIALGAMVREAELAAVELAEEGIDIEVIDPRTLEPFDTETVVASIKRTNRAVVVHEAVRSGGFGAEITSRIQEQAFDYLDAPVERVGAPFTPVPFTPDLEKLYVPDAGRIADACRRTMARG